MRSFWMICLIFLTSSCLSAQSQFAYVKCPEGISSLPVFATLVNGAGAALAANLSCDERVSVVDSDGSWTKVVLPSGKIGYASVYFLSPTTSSPSISTPVVSPAAQKTIELQENCKAHISFAIAAHGTVFTSAPDFVDKWIEKNKNRYPRLCFSQVPSHKSANFLLVFSTSQSAFNGFYPTVRTSTSVSTGPVYGSGTVTDNYGDMWNYTYSGTVTTTTTTTQQVDVPYTDTANTLFLAGYDEHGVPLFEHWRTVSSRQGGDPYNTLGYNLGSLLGSIHYRQHLLKQAVDHIYKRLN